MKTRTSADVIAQCLEDWVDTQSVVETARRNNVSYENVIKWINRYWLYVPPERGQTITKQSKV